MSMIKKIATAGAVAAMGLGLGAASASAYSVSGGAYTGTATSAHTFTVGGGAYTISCANATFAGTATGAATTAFTPSYSNCTFFGFPATVTQHGPWSMTVTGGPNAAGEYTGKVEIPAGTSTTINVPLAGCTVVVSGYQDFPSTTGGSGTGSGTGVNSGGGVDLSASVGGVDYVATGCPFSSDNDGTYNTNGDVTIPGISIS